MKIKDQHVLITGASRGIGLAFAEMASKENAYVHLVLRSPQPYLEQNLRALGAKDVITWIADLSQRSHTEDLIQKLKNQRIDILFNNAGQLTGGLLEEQPLNEIYSMLQVNVSSLIHLTRGLLPGMIQRGHGKIINNSSVSAFMHFPCASTYAASKAAVVAFTNCLEAELTNTGVSTLCLITPGIKTRMFDEIENKYGKNFEVPTDSISPDEYALQIRDAILSDSKQLKPKGFTGVGLWISRYIPSTFNSIVQKRFKR